MTRGMLLRPRACLRGGRLCFGSRYSVGTTASIAAIVAIASRPSRLYSTTDDARPSTSTSTSTPTATPPSSVTSNGKTYATDKWFNIPANVLEATNRRLHLQDDHPVAITRQIIERVFPKSKFTTYNTHPPVVSTYQNFDSLGFAQDHPGRSRSDTYYISSQTLLRTHTSAHQKETFSQSTDGSPGYLISADVYRRDEIDRCHYPVFHQMEGALTWDRRSVPNGDLPLAIHKDIEEMSSSSLLHNHQQVHVEDPNPAFHPKRNPLQTGHHTPSEVEAVAAHLKRSLEIMAVEIITRARSAAAIASGVTPDEQQQQEEEDKKEPLRVRWVEAYFPFTSPSWELEIMYGGDWLEVLGCGVVKQSLLVDAGAPSRVGWAFGIGLERIAMLLFNIPDIRLFWSRDPRFLSQFVGMSDAVANADFSRLKCFQPFSKFPKCYKDVSFWLRSVSAAGGNTHGVGTDDFHENDIMEIVREVAGDHVEDVRLVDEFTHPGSGRKSICYRINYRSLEKTLTNGEVNRMHANVRAKLVERFGVELR